MPFRVPLPYWRGTLSPHTREHILQHPFQIHDSFTGWGTVSQKQELTVDLGDTEIIQTAQPPSLRVSIQKHVFE